MGSQTRNLEQKVTKWTVSTDGFGGFTYGAPITFDCRWEDRETTFRDDEGNEQVSNVIVYLEKDVAIGDYIAEGEYDATVTDPTTVGGKRVRQFNKIPNLRNTEMQRKAFL